MTRAPVIAVVGPSGVGKDSVIDALVARAPGLHRMCRVITRPESACGEDFARVSEAEFDRMEGAGAFVLSWSAHGLRYGVPVEIVMRRQEAQAVVVNLSRRVLLRAQDVFGSLIVISLTAAPEVLAQRLAARGREDAAGRARRLARAAPLPEELTQVIETDNSGPLDATVTVILDRLQLERA
ncbi:MAG: phosphonate metabolism protein/1,5-bisphosphokinase (PRPP-forming) PhnN [Ruegeria sp.]